MYPALLHLKVSSVSLLGLLTIFPGHLFIPSLLSQLSSPPLFPSVQWQNSWLQIQTFQCPLPELRQGSTQHPGLAARGTSQCCSLMSHPYPFTFQYGLKLESEVRFTSGAVEKNKQANKTPRNRKCLLLQKCFQCMLYAMASHKALHSLISHLCLRKGTSNTEAQTVRIGFVQPWKEKASGRPNCNLPVPDGNPT